MEYEDSMLVGFRVCLLFLLILFGIPANLLALCMNARSLRTNGLNGIAYLHLAFVDLLACLVHAPVALGLELSGYFSLQNDLGDELRSLLFFLNKHFSFRVFSFTSVSSLVTLAAIALMRCWRVHRPFSNPRKMVMVTLLAVPDALTLIFLIFFQTVPQVFLVSSKNNVSENDLSNFSSGDLNISYREFPEELPSQEKSGKTLTEDHGTTKSILTYTVMATLLILTACYSLICYRIHKGFKRLRSMSSQTGTKNVAEKHFLKRQVSHVKTQLILILTLLITAMPSLILIAVEFEANYAIIRLNSTVVAFGSAINPYVYCLLVASNREAALRCLRCYKKTELKRQHVVETKNSDVDGSGTQQQIEGKTDKF